MFGGAEPWIKYALTRVGERCSPRTLHQLNASIDYAATGAWMRSHGFDARRRVAEREDVFNAIAAELDSGRILYLEFGVFGGHSMRYWSDLLKDRDACLHGFDTFEGLPDDWNIASERGRFSTGGRLPDIADPRVTFFPGLFEDVLPGYEPPRHDQLVVNCDADLYSSTRTVLAHVEAFISVGTFVYFDEFSDRFHEQRAFDHFLNRVNMGFRLVAANRELSRVAFQRVS
jgi:hypothetical protein